MKKIITFLTILSILFGTFTLGASAKAAEIQTQTQIVPLENGDYLETTLSDTPGFSSGIETFSNTKTITKTKTTRRKNKEGTTLWSVSIRATFTYNGSSSKCISCSHSTTCPAKTWKIKSVSSKKSGNSATATAVATQSFNHISKDFTKSVTISCSKNGIVS